MKYLLQKINKKIVYGLVGAFLVLQCIWMVINHPRQYVYFNVVGTQFAERFDRDTWRVAGREMLDWVLEQQDGRIAVSGATDSIMLLDDKDKDRVRIDKDNPDYILESYRNVIGNTVVYDGYEEVYTIYVDDYKIASVFRKLA